MPPAAAPASAPPVPPRKTPSGPAKALAKLGLVRDIDLALHLPLRYEDETRLTPIAQAREGQTVQVQATVRHARIEPRPRRQFVVTVEDESEALVLRFLTFYPSHQKAFEPGALVRIRGEVRHGFFGREMVHPSFKVVEPDTPLAVALTPVYPTSAQLPQAYLRKAVSSGLARAPLAEIVPADAVPPGLPPLREALSFLHHPPPRTPLATLEDHTHPAWQRLKFEELLAQQLSQLQAQRERATLKAPGLRATVGGLPERLLGVLPFSLTGAQQRVANEIAEDLARDRPMHRLLQGDVGAGKTVVAALAAAVAIDAGWQCALMAPTEILAEQHFAKLVHWLEPLGVRVAWLTGSLRSKAKRDMLAQVASGEARLVVGTHAVIQDHVQFQRLGLAIVDEQHRFGVAQRLALRRKLDEHDGQAALEPHLLMMSATPIPRTLAMTYYADLDVSTIDELPPGRTPIVTKVFGNSRRDEVVGRIRDEVGRGAQVYWVCPLIEESEKLDLQNATETHAQLSAALPGVSVGLLHGRMPPAEKASVMAQFAGGAMGVLVATTVIEVGVDVPNASLMVIEHAERFGLSQLHQLRGRVGRGAKASVCVLLYSAPLSDSGKQRLRAMAETTDGFEIARRDLEIRGPGEFMGARQSPGRRCFALPISPKTACCCSTPAGWHRTGWIATRKAPTPRFSAGWARRWTSSKPKLRAMNSTPIAFIGGGNMATAILGGLRRAGTPGADLLVLDPNPDQRARLQAEWGVQTVAAAGAELARAATVVWAVKPQSFKEAAAAVAPHTAQALHFSVMAGIRSGDMARALGTPRIVRSMPNTPALIGQGVAGLYARDEGDERRARGRRGPDGAHRRGGVGAAGVRPRRRHGDLRVGSGLRVLFHRSHDRRGPGHGPECGAGPRAGAGHLRRLHRAGGPFQRATPRAARAGHVEGGDDLRSPHRHGCGAAQVALRERDAGRTGARGGTRRRVRRGLSRPSSTTGWIRAEARAT